MRVLPPVPGAELTAALAAALDGGPPVLPTTDPRVLAAVRPDEPLEFDDAALVVPTSGSTGEPKGVVLTAANLRASATATERRLGGPGQWLLALPVTHIAGLQVLVRSLLAGTQPVVLPPGPFTAEAFTGARLTADRRYVSLVPTQLRRLLGAPAAVAALHTFDAVLLGGASAPRSLLDEAREAGVGVVTTYGMTETAGGCVYDGAPLDGVDVELDDDGRIRLRGPVVARGYRLRPDLTAEHFVDGAFRTSDLGRLVDGRLVVDGRVDDVVVTGGEKVPPGPVEVALLEHPAVAEAAVVGVPDEEWGARLVAAVVLRPGAALDLAQVREHVAARVSRVAAPRELHVLDTLPLLASGKPDRRALQVRLTP